MKQKVIQFSIPEEFTQEQRGVARRAIKSYIELTTNAIKKSSPKLEVTNSSNGDTYELVWDARAKITLPPSHVVASMQVQLFDSAPDRFDVVNPIIRTITLFEVNNKGLRKTKPMTKNGFMFMELMEKKGATKPGVRV